MNNTDKKAHWENIYTTRSPDDVSWYQNRPDISLRLIANCELASDEPLIDVGGGASVLVDHLLDAGYRRVSVLDISENALAFTQSRLGERADAVDWIASDITEFKPPQRYALWHDRAVFHFLTDAADRAAYITALRAGLRQGGHLILAAFEIGGPTKCSNLDIVQYDADKLCSELGEDFRLVEQTSEMHITPANKEQEFGWYRFSYQD